MKVLQEHIKVNEQNEGNIITIKTRFGEIKVNIDKQINFPNGILGFENFTQFCLANFPDETKPEFKVLQSIQNHELSLLVFPLADFSNFSEIYETKDLAELADKINLNPQNIVLLGVVSIQKNFENKIDLTVNLRAPLILDIENFQGYQHVFINDKYQIKYKLND